LEPLARWRLADLMKRKKRPAGKRGAPPKGLDLLFHRDDGAMQPHRRHHAAHAAQILGSTFQPVVLEIARDVDDGVASRAPRLLLKRYDGAYESNIAGLLV